MLALLIQLTFLGLGGKPAPSPSTHKTYLSQEAL